MLQLPHDTLLDVSMTGNGKIHLTSNLMKNVEVQCVLELASKVSAGGLQTEITRVMKCRDKLGQTPHTTESQEEARNVPETSFQDTNDTERGLDEVPEVVPPAESRLPVPEPLTEERKAQNVPEGVP